MSRTYKAAYIADDGSSSGGGLRLTSEDQSNLTDAALVSEAMKEAKSLGIEITEDDISVGDWTE